MKKIATSILCVVIIVVINGCATPHSQKLQKVSLMTSEQSSRAMLDARIGNWTYDDAIGLFGKPIRITKGIEVIVAEWVETGICTAMIRGMPWPVKNEWQLKISFRKEDGVMTSYNLRFIENEPL